MGHLVKLHDVWKMLDACAPGHTKTASRHYWTVSFNKRSYRSLPLGAHGRRKNPEIETGQCAR
jgi:hypothetical protein